MDIGKAAVLSNVALRQIRRAQELPGTLDPQPQGNHESSRCPSSGRPKAKSHGRQHKSMTGYFKRRNGEQTQAVGWERRSQGPRST